MISAGKGGVIKKVTKYTNMIMCEGSHTSYGAKLTKNKVCVARVTKAIKDAVSKYKLGDSAAKKTLFMYGVRRMIVAHGVFRQENAFRNAAVNSRAKAELLNSRLKMYVMSPNSTVRDYRGKNVSLKIRLYDPINHKTTPPMTFLQAIDFVAKVAGSVKAGKKDIVLPSPLLQEMINIEKALPPGWKRNLIMDRLRRLYLDAKNELILRGDLRIGEDDYAKKCDLLAKEIVAWYRAMAYTAATGASKVPPNPPMDKVLEGYAKKDFLWYASISHAHSAKVTQKKAPFKSKLKYTDYDGGLRAPAYKRAVAKYKAGAEYRKLGPAQRLLVSLKLSGTRMGRRNRRRFSRIRGLHLPKPADYRGGRNSRAYIRDKKKELEDFKKSSKKKMGIDVDIVINSSIKSKIDSGATLPLSKTSYGTPAAKGLSFEDKIFHANAIRAQMEKALKRFYPDKAGISGDYDAKAAATRKMAPAMVKATIKGMKRFFKKHYSKDTAPDVALGDLEARGVKLVKGGTEPNYVIFKHGVDDSNAGAKKAFIYRIMTNAPTTASQHLGRRDKALRRAKAIRLWKQAINKMKKKGLHKDPKKVARMASSLAAAAEKLPTDKLLLVYIRKIGKNGATKVGHAPRALLKYNRLKRLGRAANPKNPDFGQVAILDKVIELYRKALKIARDNGDLKTDGSAKKAALAKKIAQLPRDYTRRGSGHYIEDLFGKTVDGVKFTKKGDTYNVKLTLKDKKIGGKTWSELLKKGILAEIDFLGGKLRVLGKANYTYRRLLGADANTHILFLQFGLEQKWGWFKMGLGASMVYLSIFPAMFNTWSEKTPVMFAPMFDLASTEFDLFIINAYGWMGAEKAFGKNTISAKVTGGNLYVPPHGIDSKAISWDPALGHTPLSTPNMNGVLANVGFSTKRKWGKLSLNAVGGGGVGALLTNKDEAGYGNDGSRAQVGFDAGYKSSGERFTLDASFSHDRLSGGKRTKPGLPFTQVRRDGNHNTFMIDIGGMPVKWGGGGWSVHGAYRYFNRNYTRGDAPTQFDGHTISLMTKLDFTIKDVPGFYVATGGTYGMLNWNNDIEGDCQFNCNDVPLSSIKAGGISWWARAGWQAMGFHVGLFGGYNNVQTEHNGGKGSGILGLYFGIGE